MRLKSLAGVPLVLGVVSWVGCLGNDPEAGPPTPNTVDASTVDAFGDAVAPPPRALAVEAASTSSCALLSDGTVWCWGSNALGQIGVSPPGAAVLPPTRVEGLSEVVALSAGTHTACAVKKDGTVWCWGRNSEGQIGHAPTAGQDSNCGDFFCTPVPTQVPGVFASSVSVNGATTCAVSTNKRVICWGSNAFGLCGTTPAGGSCVPTTIPGLSNVTRINLGYFATSACAIDESARLWCWGSNALGELGHSPGTQGDVATGAQGAIVISNATPQQVGLENVVDVVASLTTCAVLGDGTVWCWGRNGGNHLNLEQADSSAHPTPVRVLPIADARSVRSGDAYCALLANGDSWCWGVGRVATGPKDPNGGCHHLLFNLPAACAAPAKTPAQPLQSFDSDMGHAVGITTDGDVITWGQNPNGQLGHAPGAESDVDGGVDVPSRVAGLPGQ